MGVVTNIQVLADWLDPEGRVYFQLENLEISLEEGQVYLSIAGGPDLARYKLEDLQEDDD
jgi:hypothetical protein